MRIIALIVLALVFVGTAHSAGLPVEDIERLLEASHSHSDHDDDFIRAAMAVPEFLPTYTHPDADRAVQGYQESFRIPNDLSKWPFHTNKPTSPRILDEGPSQQNPATEPQHGQIAPQQGEGLHPREPVLVPFTLKPLSWKERKDELEALSIRFRQYSTIVMQYPRSVLPLVKFNMLKSIYETTYKHGLVTPTGRRCIWTIGNSKYLLVRPFKSRLEFSVLHGRIGHKNENFWGVWKQETHGQAKIWRYLGSMELPTHKYSDRVMRETMEEVPKPYTEPEHYFNNAGHLDFGQTPA